MTCEYISNSVIYLLSNDQTDVKEKLKKVVLLLSGSRLYYDLDSYIHKHINSKIKIY